MIPLSPSQIIFTKSKTNIAWMKSYAKQNLAHLSTISAFSATLSVIFVFIIPLRKP